MAASKVQKSSLADTNTSSPAITRSTFPSWFQYVPVSEVLNPVGWKKLKPKGIRCVFNLLRPKSNSSPRLDLSYEYSVRSANQLLGVQKRYVRPRYSFQSTWSAAPKKSMNGTLRSL